MFSYGKNPRMLLGGVVNCKRFNNYLGVIMQEAIKTAA
jgi:hypothetical protein